MKSSKGVIIDMSEKEMVSALNDFMDDTDRYFKENIGMSAGAGVERTFDYDCYPAEDILRIAFKFAISTNTAEKIIFMWNNHDLSEVIFYNPIFASLEALGFNGMYDQILEIVKERKAKEEKEKISSLITAQVETQGKKRI